MLEIRARLLLALLPWLPLGCDSATPRIESAANGSRTAPAAMDEPKPSASAASLKPETLYLPDAQTNPAPDPTPAAPSSPSRIAVIGDSLTDYESHGGGFLRYIERSCPGVRIDNFAKGGAMVNQMRRRFEATVLAAAPGTYSHLIVFGGVNDLYSDLTAGRTVDKITADLESMYRAARERDMVVIAINVAPWGGFERWYNARRGAATQRLNAWIMQQQSAGLIDHVVDAHSLLSCDESAALCPKFERRIADGLHFNAAAHEKLGQALLEGPFAACSQK